MKLKFTLWYAISTMDKKWLLKVTVFGILNFLGRFLVGGILINVLKLNPIGFSFGFWITLTTLIVAYILMKYVVRPISTQKALKVGVTWAAIALILDIIAEVFILRIVSTSYLLSEIQTWTRLLVIVLVAPLTVRKNRS